MKVIWLNGPQDIKAPNSEESRQSNNIFESYLTRLFSYVSPYIGYPKLRIRYLSRTEIIKNAMV